MFSPFIQGKGGLLSPGGGVRSIGGGVFTAIASGETPFGARINACASVTCSLLVDRILHPGAIDATANVSSPGIEIEVPLDVAPINATASVIAEFSTGATTPAEAFALLEAGDDSTLLAAMGLSGRAIDHYVIMTASDGGADKVGSGDIDVTLNTPLFEEPDATLGIDNTCMDGNTDGVFSTGGTDWDVGVESMAVVYVGSLTQQLTNGGAIFSKGTNPSYSLRGRPSGGLGAVILSSGTTTAAVNLDHWDTDSTSPICALMVNDRDADDFSLHTNKGSSTAMSAVTTTLSNTGQFKFGFAGGLAAGNIGICHGLIAIFTGADAEGIDSTHLDNLVAYLNL